MSSLCFFGKGSVSLFCSFPFAVGWHVLCPVLVADLLSYFWKTVSARCNRACDVDVNGGSCWTLQGTVPLSFTGCAVPANLSF